MRTTLMTLCMACFLTQPGAAQKALNPWNVDTLNQVTSAEISPDGQQIAYVVTHRKRGNTPTSSVLVVISFEGGIGQEISTKGPIGQLSWSKDSKSLIYVSRGGESLASVYRQSFSGEPKRLFSPRASVSHYTMSPDEKSLVYTCTRPTDAARKASLAKGHNQVVYEEDWRPVDMYTVDLGTGAQQLLLVKQTPWSPSFSPDGKKLAFWLTPTPLIDDKYMLRRLHVMDLATGAVKRVGSSKGKVGVFKWSPDSQRIAYIAGRDAHDPKESSVFMADLSDQPNAILTDKDFEGHITDIHWSDDKSLILATNEGCQMGLVLQPAGGGTHVRMLPKGEAIWTHVSYSHASGRMALIGNTARHPSELFAYNEGERTARRITQHNNWLAQSKMGKQSVVKYTARDGLQIEGILIKPVGYKKGNQYPLIVVVHGGPESNLFDGWLTAYSRPGQMAAAQGYMVFHPNYRASTGRGVVFSQADQGDLAAAEFDDLVDGVEYLCKQGLVDRAKVGVTGGSYGGYASAWCATKLSKHFAASVMFVGISNQISKRGTTDIPNEDYLVHWKLRTWDAFQRVLESSPIYHVKNAQTPILICHGKDDPRVSVTQSMELYRMLKTKGDVPVRLVLYPGEGHGNRKTPARLDYAIRMMRWFDHYLKGKGGAKPPMSVNYRD